MQKAILFFAILAIAAIAVGGCGSSSHPGTSNSDVPVVITMQDAPPTGVTVLDFDVTVSGIQLTTSGGTNVNLLTSPVTVNLSNLQTAPAVIANTTAPAGTYSSIMITFSTPSLTFENGTTGTITVGTTTCNVGTTCTVSETLNQASTTVSSTPFPLTLAAGTPVDLNLDFNTANSLQADLSVTPTVTVTSVPTTNGNLTTLETTGQITSTSSGTFTVTDINTGMPVVVTTNGSTTFNGFNTSATCTTANTAACLATNQNVDVVFTIPESSPNTPTATSVTLESGITNGIEGMVTSVNAAQNQFTMVVNGFSPSQTGATIGETLTVTLASGATFEIEPTANTNPSGLTFASVSDLIAGQEVEIDVPSGTSITSGAVTADVVLLLPSQFTGTLSAVNGQNLTLNGLNGVFTTAGTNTLTVDTLPTTTFTGVSGVTGLTMNQPVIIDGEVFNSPTGVVVVGGTVVQTTTTAAATRVAVQ